MIQRLLQKVGKVKQLKPIASILELNSSYAGYRNEGLFFDDLIPEESDLVKEALSRLTPQQQAERQFRIRRALNLSLKKITLDTPVTAQEVFFTNKDVSYLKPVLAQLEKELDTRLNYLNMTSPPAHLLNRNRAN